MVGLAPSAVAAQVLADDLGIQTENTAKWLDTHDRAGETFRKGQLVIVDEASLAGTLSLDRITALAAEAGAKVPLVGDHAQLQSVTAGGAFSLLVHDRDDAPELVDVHRFVHPWEKTASLAPRHGRTDVIDTYTEHGRIRGGETEEMIDVAYTAWRNDTLAGRASVLVTASNESVQALNNRARADLILDGTVNARREVELHDGMRVAVGDTVITRRNDRRLRAGRSWVRNGDRWTVTEVRDDGALTLRRAGRTWGASVVVPAEYAAEHLDLGYAVTSYRAQGITVDSSHVLADASMTRETFYVAMTRGREQNIAYVAVDKPDPAHDGPRPGDNTEATARSVLFGVPRTSVPSCRRTRRSLRSRTPGPRSRAYRRVRDPGRRRPTRPLGRARPLVWAQRRRRRGRDRLTRIRSADCRAPSGRGQPARRRDPLGRASCEHAGSGTPTTSPRSCTTVLPARPPGQREPGVHAEHHVSSWASSPKPPASCHPRCGKR